MMFSGEEKESSRVASKAKCRKTTTIASTSSRDCHRYHSFQTGVSWHFRSRKDQVLQIELIVAHWQASVISAILRLRVKWPSHLAPIMTQSFLPRVPTFQVGEIAGKKEGSY